MLPDPSAKLEDLRFIIRNPFLSKAVKEDLLRQIRSLEAQLGIESEPYNASDGI